MYTLRSSNSTHAYINEYICAQKELNKNVSGCYIHKSQTLETLGGEWINKLWNIHIIFSNKKANYVSCNNIDKSKNHCVDQKNAVAKLYEPLEQI